MARPCQPLRTAWTPRRLPGHGAMLVHPMARQVRRPTSQPGRLAETGRQGLCTGLVGVRRRRADRVDLIGAPDVLRRPHPVTAVPAFSNEKRPVRDQLLLRSWEPPKREGTHEAAGCSDSGRPRTRRSFDRGLPGTTPRLQRTPRMVSRQRVSTSTSCRKKNSGAPRHQVEAHYPHRSDWIDVDVKHTGDLQAARPPPCSRRKVALIETIT